jgi:hypothetical protein
MASGEDDEKLARDVGFDPAVLALIRRHTRKNIDRMTVPGSDWDSIVPGPGLSVKVTDGAAAEALRALLQPALGPLGYRAFWSSRQDPRGLNEGDEVVVIKSADRYQPLRVRQTDAGNYDISTDDIIDRLKAWEQLCNFDVVGAASDWVALTFESLPERICAFAEEVYLFCPDSVSQGVGLKRERDHPQLYAAARELCPTASPRIRDELKRQMDDVDARAAELSPELLAMMGNLRGVDGGSDGLAAAAIREAEMGVRLLAKELKEKKYLFLWWD